MSDNSGATVIPRMKARKMSKKMPFSGQKSEEIHMNIHQWNARGLSNPKMTEIKKTINAENIDVLIIKEANVTNKNIKFYNKNDCIKADKLQVAFWLQQKPLLKQNSV
jgi:hypothetical protein